MKNNNSKEQKIKIQKLLHGDLKIDTYLETLTKEKVQ